MGLGAARQREVPDSGCPEANRGPESISQNWWPCSSLSLIPRLVAEALLKLWKALICFPACLVPPSDPSPLHAALQSKQERCPHSAFCVHGADVAVTAHVARLLM